MEPITSAMIAAALIQGFSYLGEQLAGKTFLDPILDPIAEQLRAYLPKQLRKQDERALQQAVEATLQSIVHTSPEQDDDAVQRWLKGVSLDRLVAPRNDALRRQVARHILLFTDPTADPPDDLLIALAWPRNRRQELAQLLAGLRMQLAALAAWQPLIAYVDAAANRILLQKLLNTVARFDAVFVTSWAGEALRVVVEQRKLSAEEALDLEERYRTDLVRDLRRHDFRGIHQMRKDIRLPLADIYLELSLLNLSSDEARRLAHERLLTLRQEERVVEEERRLDDRVTDALTRYQRLVILGEPGAGKTISLNFTTLMLAYGYGATRLGLATPYIPVKIRLADFARALQKAPTLALEAFLFDVIEQEFPYPRLAEYLRLAFANGACMVLLDGLDEVGDDPVQGLPLRIQVVRAVQRLGDRHCAEDGGNRLVVTSRIEGYWQEALRDFQHVQLSPLRPPDEIEAFLLRWYTAHEIADDPALAISVAEARAQSRVNELAPRILGSPSVRRLATNPLLLTILALIHENVGRLPNRRIELYKICAQTLIESWRAAQTGISNELLAELGESLVLRIMAPLAYWLHEENPGGTAAYAIWREQLVQRLIAEDFVEDATKIADNFLHYARQSAGLLAERGLGQIGFFHLTFEEYLAALAIADSRKEHREILQKHWEDPRWREVILLAAGRLGSSSTSTDDASDFLSLLLQMQAADPASEGRQVVLAGRALADMGIRSVNGRIRRWVFDELKRTMQDRDPETEKFNVPPRIPIRTRYEAGEILDELGWLPDDLNHWVHCPACADDGGDLLVTQYPITNLQFARFVETDGYTNPSYWGGEESDGWRWRTEKYNKEWRGEEPVHQPEYWQDLRFGKERRGYPVVGISWYEVTAFAAWLSDLLEGVRTQRSGITPEDCALVEDLLKAGAVGVRLPTEEEWRRLAGGIADEQRYPWDDPQGPATSTEEAILARANTSEAGLQGTSPVAMYPQGRSQPHLLHDVAGNSWEWTASWYDKSKGGRVLCGGSWDYLRDDARCGFRSRHTPDFSLNLVGCRLVAPIGSGF